MPYKQPSCRPKCANISSKLVQDTTIKVPATEDKNVITKKNIEGLSTFKPVNFKMPKSSVIMEKKEKSIAPKITSPKPNILKLGSYARNKSHSVQMKEEKNESVKSKVCANSLVLFIFVHSTVLSSC